MLLLLVACTGPAKTPPGDDPAAETAETGDSAPDVDPCLERGLTRREWDASGTDGAFDTVAPDFSVALVDGTTFSYADRFTGCDSVVAVLYDPDLSIAYPDFSTRRDTTDWLEATPQNVEYLIFASGMREEDRLKTLTALQADIDNGIDNLDDADAAAFWAEHIHYVTENPGNLDGAAWISDLYDAYGSAGVPVNFGIDRFQTVRELGYLADPVTGWAEAPPVFLAYDAQWFNQQSDLQDRLDADGATVVRPFESTAERTAVVELPDAATMAGFDTFELDLSFICNGHPDTTGCGEWDYLAYVYLCDNDDPATTDVDESGTCTEIGRFITAYARGGRWVVDASPFLAELADGGEHTFRVDSANAPYITLDLRFSNQGKGIRPVAMEYLWSGGSWNADYDTLHAPITFTPPAGTTHVELWALITGHGYGQDRENCAEFCNHQHAFTVNDALTVTQEFPMAGTDYGCAEQIAEGTVPNQYGTWVLGRGGWCPGKQVDPYAADLTDAVDLGGENTITYQGLFEGETYVPVPYDSGQGFGANTVVSSWLVYYQ